MSSSSAMSLKVRIIQMLWVGNAFASAFLALLGGVMFFESFGRDAQLPALTMRAGAALAAMCAALTVYSLSKARSTSASRQPETRRNLPSRSFDTI